MALRPDASRALSDRAAADGDLTKAIRVPLSPDGQSCREVVAVLNPLQNIAALEKEFDGASDRAAAIVAGAFIDEVLSDLLRTFFVDDTGNDRTIFEGTGPLATFSSKINIAYGLGLISASEHRIMHTVRSIRNDFAHELAPISFEDQSIKARCKNIEVPIEMVAPKTIPLSQDGETPPLPKIQKAGSDNPRAVFQEAIITLMHILAARVADAGEDKRRSPADFIAAYEPGERLLDHLKSLLQQRVSLSENGEDIEQSLRKFRLLVEVQEFCIRQMRAAHAGGVAEGGPAA